ncbi:MMPL family transporter [Streptomyces sp. DSM 44915]|uniref:MMPL family transporter n=1 Tax=Streptomyces chisholmiae TaxID=3075540 RepID=A0ABU2K0D0_9ACTN|nr:MMPL family transporter [Streptomyces sp. DSM 44915]MDT0270444.1 MMPL family transporter [Streptomyces sp. DSM 44915]
MLDVPTQPHPARSAGAARTRLGTALRRGKWPMLLLWIALAVLATPLAERLGEVERDDAAAYLPTGLDSSEVADLLEPDPDQPPGAETAIVVFARDGEPLDAADLAAVEATRAAAAGLDVPGLGEPGATETAEDGAAALFTLDVRPADEESADDAVTALVEGLRAVTASTLDDADRPGLTGRVAGEAGIDVDNDGGDVDAALMLTSMAIVAVLLLVIYRSPLLWLVPLITALLAVQVSRGAAYGLAEAGLPVTDISSAILIVLVFGAATDYAMLLLNRYREELSRHADRHEAMAESLRRTTPALVASAGTVTAGLLCLLVADLAGLRGLGPIAAAGVLVALLAMLTLLPAILVCGGRWLLWPRAPRPGAERGATEHRFWGGVARGVGRRPRLAAGSVMLLLAVGALGLTSLSTSADPLDKVPPGSESVEGQRLIAAHFPQGLAAPLRVVLPASADGAAAVAAAELAETVPGVALAEVGPEVRGHPTLVVPLAVDPYGDAARAAIDALDAALNEAQPGTLVGGTPAVQTDYEDTALRDTTRIVPLVLLAVTVILGLLLRSLVTPLVLLGTIVLSLLGSLGVSALVFEHGFGFGGVAGDMFVYIFVFLVALGTDYTIFLMERIREERRRTSTREAVRIGLTTTGGVIAAAGLVLAGTFSALAQLPDVTVAEVGIAVGIGVLLDTLLVRSLLVPGLVTLLGDRAWWPSRPGREKAEGASVAGREEPGTGGREEPGTDGREEPGTGGREEPGTGGREEPAVAE